MRTIPIFILAAHAVFAGCVSFGDTKPGSKCSQASNQLKWLNAPATPAKAPESRASYDTLLDDPAFSTGVYVSGETAFQFSPQGKHIVEIFLTTMDGEKYSFVLKANDAVLDDRFKAITGPDRLAPTSGLRRPTLLGIVEGGQTIRIQTQAPRYVLSAIRWTPQEEFERNLVPVWLERARKLLKDPFADELLSRRRNNLQHLFDRLVLSRQEAVKREALLGLTRSYYWVAAENHRKSDLDRLEQLFLEGLKLMPQDKLLREMITASCTELNIRINHMPSGPYCKQVAPVAWEVSLPPAPKDAPQWAIEQRILAARMTEITRWWVEKRQRSNGELGGGWDDDSEILRHWSPLALGLGSPVAAAGIKKLSEGLWSSGIISKGYDRRIGDVEHSSEASADTQPVLAALFPDDSAVRSRLAETTACAGNWIVKQPDNRWRFRGSWFNCTDFDPKPERAVDVHLNVRALGPAMWHAYLTRDKETIGLFAKWAESWVEAMRSTAHGKPAGLFPSAVRSSDGSYLILSKEWDKPNVEWDYYQWSGWAQEGLASFLLAVHDLTGDARWLKAAGETFQVMEQCGSHAKLCEEIRKEPQAFYEWRRRSGDARYDKYFEYSAKPEVSSILAMMAEHAHQTAHRLSVNFDMFTSEPMYTDRIYYQLTPEYRQHLFGGDAPRGERYPTFAVTWPTSDADFARAVIDSSDHGLRLQVYNFRTAPSQYAVRAWNLKAGQYRWKNTDRKGAVIASGELAVSARPQVLQIPMPAQQEVTTTIERAGK